jgi:hypothetical protein
MGTNYHLHKDACPHCGRSDPPLHIGKQSAGWRFIFRGDLGPQSFAEWKLLLAEGRILGDDDEPVPLEEFVAMVEARQGGKVELFDSRDFLDEEGHPFHRGEFS